VSSRKRFGLYWCSNRGLESMARISSMLDHRISSIDACSWSRSDLVLISFLICYLLISLWDPFYIRFRAHRRTIFRPINLSFKRFKLALDRKHERSTSLYVPRLQLTFRLLILPERISCRKLSSGCMLNRACATLILPFLSRQWRETTRKSLAKNMPPLFEANSYFVVNRPSNVRSRSMEKCIKRSCLQIDALAAYCALFSANVDWAAHWVSSSKGKEIIKFQKNFNFTIMQRHLINEWRMI